MSHRLFDGHCDTAFELWQRGECLAKNTCHIDLEKAKVFKAYAQVFAFCSYANDWASYGNTPEDLLAKPLKILQAEVAKNPEKIAFASNKAELISCNESGKIAALLSIEGPEVISCNPERLYDLQKQDFVMTTLTWNGDNTLAGFHGSEQGLTDLGKAFVKTAQSLGILIDVSHLSDRAFWDLMDITTAPIVASHSNCRRLCDYSRNLTDDQLRAIAQTGGTVGLNLYVPFLGHEADYTTLRHHLEYMLTLCGENHVALGGDLDGCDELPKGFQNVSDYLSFFDCLQAQGYPEALLDKIFYTNLLNLMI